MKMSNLIKGLSIAVLGLFAVSTVAFADAKTDKTAKEASKPTVIVVSSHACPMCTEFDSRVLNNPEVKKELSRFTFKKVDASATKIRVEVTPTVVIYDRGNKEIKKFVPSLDKAKFITILKQIN